MPGRRRFIATAALTLVRHGEPAAVVRAISDGQPTTFSIDVADVATYVTESAAPRQSADRTGRRDGCRAELLADGLAIVDTPGASGGMSGGHAAATLGFLPFADGLVFVTDLTSELNCTGGRFPPASARALPCT
ncbi:MAG: hypothetical protein H6514_15685 [Acidimicrobiaceae bacterium]|nr:hypothetical protein [Acidimicrobiaceae bacterium]